MTPIVDPRLPASLVVVDAGARGGFSLLPRLRTWFPPVLLGR